LKLLRKLLLINWHYFSYQVVEFDNINFLTGKNASGKTTIIDAIQLLMLGDTAGHFFNKSASDKSSRTLKGYLRCEFGDSDDGQIVYLRNGRFASYVVMEFEDTIENKSFTIGVQFDNYEDGSNDSRFFYINDKIPENNFIEANLPLDSKQLKAFLLSKHREVKFFETNSGYREFIKERLGQLNNSYFSLFKKSIPFSPISNIEQFITEYVCDVKNEIDIVTMQDNIRTYKRLEIEASEVEARVTALKEINDSFDNYKKEADKLEVNRYLFDRIELAASDKKLNQLNDENIELQNEISDKRKILTTCLAQIESLNKQRDGLVSERSNSDQYQQRAILEKRQLELKQKIDELESKVLDLKENINSYAYAWLTKLDAFLKYDNPAISSDLLFKLREYRQKIEGYKNEISVSAKLITTFQTDLSSLQDLLSGEIFNLKSNDSTLRKELSDLNIDITALNAGNKNYNPQLLKFKTVMEEELKKQFNRKINVNFLADLFDIKDEQWRMPLETFLLNQRFYLIIEPKYVDAAINIYERIKRSYNFSEFGILDTDKISKINFEMSPNSIVEEIITENELVKKYLTNLMGTLIKVEKIEDLRKNNRSITKTGMLYQGYVARQLNFNKTSPFIGSQIAFNQLSNKKQQAQELTSKLTGVGELIRYFEGITNLETINTNEFKQAQITLTDAQILPGLKSEYQSVTSGLSTLGDNYLQVVDENIAKIEVTLVDLDQERLNLNNDITRNELKIQRNNEELIPSLKTKFDETKKKISETYTKNWMLANGEPAFMSLAVDHKDVATQLNPIKSVINSLTGKVSYRWNQVLEQRVKYNTSYLLTNDPNTTDNNYYQTLYDELLNTKLSQYKEKILVAKENAINQFKNDFLAKLKANFDTVITQIENLNSALENAKFGDDSYKFLIQPRSEFKIYYNMINDPLLLSGNDINSDIFKQKYNDVIEELFRQITFVDRELDLDLRAELEKNIQRFSDYRSYLQFDLQVTNKNGNKHFLSRSLQKKSGGETQTPFYISVLASFAQAYHVNESSKINAIRLIIFDEAFSKMDAERIAQSVKLLRGFGLQAILSAPPEKMSDISGLVDKNLCVVRNNTQAVVSEFKDTRSKDF
jgi:chromosome segregation ATPase